MENFKDCKKYVYYNFLKKNQQSEGLGSVLT